MALACATVISSASAQNVSAPAVLQWFEGSYRTQERRAADFFDSLINQSVIIKDWYEKLGKVPIFRKGKLPDLETLLQMNGDDSELEINEEALDENLKSFKEKGLWIIEKEELRKDFIDDVEKDLLQFTRVSLFHGQVILVELVDLNLIKKNGVRHHCKDSVNIFININRF